MKEKIKTCFFASLTVLLFKLGASCLVTSGIGYKIGGALLVFMGIFSAGAVLHYLGLYDYN